MYAGTKILLSIVKETGTTNWNNKIDLSADLLYVDSILNKNI